MSEHPVPSSALWPPEGASEAEKHAHYARLCAIAGAEADAEGPLLLGIRGVRPRAAETHETTSRPEYDDTFVLLDRDDSGAPIVREMAGSTHPFETRSPHAPDVSGAGLGDVAMIRPGRYRVRTLWNHHGRDALRVATPEGSESIPAWRNTTHDGRFSAAQRRASEQRSEGPQVVEGLGDTATGILFHPGFDTTRGNDPAVCYSSIGCQTAGLADIGALVEVQKRRGGFDYLLVEAGELLARLDRGGRG